MSESTYRLQINKAFDFAAAAKIIPYLAELGITQLYSSPYFQAAPNSTHGYDVVDHSRANEEWGGARGLQHLCETLQRHQMGQLLDIVPNHMAIIERENPWWWDVLRNGPSSTYASFFDVDWEPPESRHHNSVLLPVLGDQYGLLLEAGKLTVVRNGAAFVVRYEDREFPVAPRSMREILGPSAALCHSDELAFLGDAYAELPAPGFGDRNSIVRRQRDIRVLDALLSQMLSQNPELAAAIDDTLSRITNDPSRLHQFLEAQNFRLAYWRMAASDLGYRRFFDINSLVGLRMEEPQVFAETHARVLEWVSKGWVSGLRVDHPDGLRDPLGYFHRLRAACDKCWIVAEKILADGEHLRETWPIDGATGYDFLNLAGGLFVDPAGLEPLTAFYREFTGESCDYQSVVRAKKQQAMRDALGSDINRLTALLLDVCENDLLHRDYSRHMMHEVLRATLACLRVYRTYVGESGAVDLRDERSITAAIEDAKAYRPDLDPLLFDFLRDVLTLRADGERARELSLRFQQTSAAVMGKGVEDTAFYTFNRMVALNEVGGDPDKFGTGVEDFCEWCEHIHRNWPKTMLSTTTHDTKRSEDARARMYLISEIPDLWRRAVLRWSKINDAHRSDGLPDRNIEYHLYQVMVGTWPIDKSRLLEYAQKASREARTHTSWTDPDEKYESALQKFVQDIYQDDEFLEALDEFVNLLIAPGRVNSLALTLIKLTAPGIPDFYQGTEVWNHTLVDPDNRRPVDFETRCDLLAETRHSITPEQIMARMDEGMPKLWLVKQGLWLRKQHPAWFGSQSEMAQLPVRGRLAGNVIAYARGGAVIGVAPRLMMRQCGNWRETEVELPPGRWTNRLTGDVIDGGPTTVVDLLQRFPVGLLSRS
ncbi:MAG: malto-oligosyltrehalose synthase [Candidatus Binatus sp.]|uniref:malto-oligosyltrehalose synthase n=1 Tax=Candidatus Binatus sp. TaxID=2811406 RepID=UPI00271AE0AF|nr:malto-oligosyltrehalose synthase [Candidatus Binatus sp.]MDO8434756.1 malto-oligosyltrehalose synthase [Candidatus Binatus sp.]